MNMDVSSKWSGNDLWGISKNERKSLNVCIKVLTRGLPEKIEKLLDCYQSVNVLFDISSIKRVPLEIAGGLCEGPKLKQIHKVEIFQPIRPLTIGQF